MCACVRAYVRAQVIECFCTYYDCEYARAVKFYTVRTVRRISRGTISGPSLASVVARVGAPSLLLLVQLRAIEIVEINEAADVNVAVNESRPAPPAARRSPRSGSAARRRTTTRRGTNLGCRCAVKSYDEG